MTLVIDASAILPLVTPDEDRTYSDAVVRTLATTAGHVSAIFWWEIWNALWVNVSRRKRISLDDAAEFLVALEDLGLQVGATPVNPGVFALSVDHDVSAYDASYLELAERLKCPIATLDKNLIRACHSRGVSVLETD